MPTVSTDFNIGKDAKVIIADDAGNEIRLPMLESFKLVQKVTSVEVKPLEGAHIPLDIPASWEGDIETSRASAALDDLIADIEAGYYGGNGVKRGTITYYVREIGGGTSCYQFPKATFHLSNAGDFASDKVVKQGLKFRAGKRIRVS